MKKRVVVGMSGGIDSSVAALLLKRAGYDVIGVQMEYWAEELCATPQMVKLGKSPILDVQGGEVVFPEEMLGNKKRKIVANKCCSDESMIVTREICDALGIPFYAYNVKTRFKEKIVDYYIEEFAAGKVPNPCTECNREIKFGELLAFADRVGADMIATGHYAQVKQDPKDMSYHIWEAVDKHKDQSYFLYDLRQEQLARIILPLGQLTKDTVRGIAEEAGLTQYKRAYKESQGLCFFPEKSPEGFLERHLPEELKIPGDFVRIDPKLDASRMDISGVDASGEDISRNYGKSPVVVGRHRGVGYYTIGQRKGLDIGGLREPYFVLGVDGDTQTVFVGPKEQLMQTHVELDRVTFQGVVPVSPIRITAKIRYRMQAVSATLHNTDGVWSLDFDAPVFAITKGQVAVFQIGDMVLGGGIIANNPAISGI